MLPVSGRSSKVSEEGATREHPAARDWKLIRNADINISSPVSTARDAVENLNCRDGYCPTVVDCKPGRTFLVCVAHIPKYQINSIINACCVSIDALGCYESVV